MKGTFFSKSRRREALFAWAILLWPVLHMAFFQIYVNVSLVTNSFLAENVRGEIYWNGLNNYIDIFRIMLGWKEGPDNMSPQAIWNTLSLFPLTYFINMPLTVGFSYMIYRKVRGYRFYRIVIFLPAMVPASVLCLVFKLAVSDQYGFFNDLLSILGLGGDGVNSFGVIPVNGWFGDPDTAWGTIIVFSFWTGLSTNLIYFCAAMTRVDVEILESAAIDGAGEFRMLFSMVLPIIFPSLTTIIVTNIAGTIGWFMPSLVLTNGGPLESTTTIGLIFTQYAKNYKYTYYISAFGIIVSVFGGLFMLLVKKLLFIVEDKVAC